MVHWKEMAEKNPFFAAAELYFIAHPDKCVPWRQLVPYPPSDANPSPKKWGCKKRRSSRPIVEEEASLREEKAPGGASPKSPLLWNGCDFSGISMRDSPAKRRMVYVGSSGRSSGGGGVSGGRGSVKTVAELRERERSLMEENVLLKWEREQQKLTRTMLTEENKRLVGLKQVLTETRTSKIEGEETKHKERRSFPFDLNLPCPADLDPDTDCDSKQMFVDYKGIC